MGEEIEHPIYGFKTRVVAIYKDLLGNERILTEHAKKHIETELSAKRVRKWRKEIREYGLHNLGKILTSPDTIVIDKEDRAVIYAVKYKDKLAAVVVGLENQHYIYTVQPMANLDSSRYIKLYEGSD